MARSPAASSSAISAPVTALRSPPPPKRLGQRVRHEPELVGLLEHGAGQRGGLVGLAGPGRISFAANWRTVSTMSCCSSVGSKSIIG